MRRQPMPTPRPLFVVLAVCLSGFAGSACRQAEPEGPALAIPSFSATRTRVALGSPVDLTYRFVVESGAQVPGENLRVMVHFLDGDEEQLWTDDHEPPVPTTGWKPGQTVEYTRTVFVPIFPYVGPVAVHMGLYSASSGQRVVLKGETTGQRSYRVGSLELVPRPEDAFIIFKDGWHNAEVSRENATVEWQWTKRAGTLSFRNPRRDATFYLHADARPDLAGEPLAVTLRIGEQQIDQFTIETRDEVVRKVAIVGSQFGDAESVDLVVDVSKTFVPATVPAAQSSDARELGIRVFHAHIEPR